MQQSRRRLPERAIVIVSGNTVHFGASRGGIARQLWIAVASALLTRLILSVW